jgi:hypothetical protein
LVKGTKLPNGSYATAEKVRYANTRLALEFMANCVATGTAADAVVALVIPAKLRFSTFLLSFLRFGPLIESAEITDCVGCFLMMIRWNAVAGSRGACGCLAGTLTDAANAGCGG